MFPTLISLNSAFVCNTWVFNDATRAWNRIQKQTKPQKDLYVPKKL